MNKALLPLILISLLIAKVALAESHVNSLKGLKQNVLIELMGPPDSKEGSLPDSTWIYGSSLIFLKDGIVVSWSDSGNLKSRANLALIRDTSKSDYEVFSRKWINLWTPKKVTTPKEVLDLLISKMDS